MPRSLEQHHANTWSKRGGHHLRRSGRSKGGALAGTCKLNLRDRASRCDPPMRLRQRSVRPQRKWRRDSRLVHGRRLYLWLPLEQRHDDWPTHWRRLSSRPQREWRLDSRHVHWRRLILWPLHEQRLDDWPTYWRRLSCRPQREWRLDSRHVHWRRLYLWLLLEQRLDDRPTHWCRS